MTSDVLDTPGAWSVGAFLSLLSEKRLLSFLRPQSDPPEAEWFTAAVANIHSAAAPVLEAANSAEVAAQLERCINPVLGALRSAKTPSKRSGDVSELLRTTRQEPEETSMGSVVLGFWHAKRLMESIYNAALIYDRSVRPMTAEMRSLARDRQELLLRALDCTPGSLHKGLVVPHRLLQSTTTQLKGLVAMFTCGVALSHETRLAPWLSRELVNALDSGVNELAWFMATLGYPAGIDLREDAADLKTLFKEADEADAAFLRQMEAQLGHDQASQES